MLFQVLMGLPDAVSCTLYSLVVCSSLRTPICTEDEPAGGSNQSCVKPAEGVCWAANSEMAKAPATATALTIAITRTSGEAKYVSRRLFLRRSGGMAASA